MTSCRAIRLIQRRGTWAMRRAVPKEFTGIESRTHITRSFPGRSKAQALKEAERLWAQQVNEWIRAKKRQTLPYVAQMDKARRRAKSEGFQFLAPRSVASLPREQIAERLKRVRTAEDEIDRDLAEALLGGVPKPTLTADTLFRAFVESLKIEDRRPRSPDQRRRLLANHRRAVDLLIEVAGDTDLSLLSDGAMAEFADTLRDREPRLSVSTRNTIYHRLQRVIREGTKYLRATLPIDFRDFVERHDHTNSRPAFSRGWIEEKLLAEGALDGLDGQLRCFLLGMINTGYRPSEGSNLLPRDIHLEAEVPYVEIIGRDRSLKTRFAPRRLPLLGISLQAFRACPEGFPDWRDRSSLSNVINRHLSNANLRETPEHSLYSLRHGFQQRLIETGCDRRLQAELMGHSDGRPSYSRPLPIEMLADVMARVAI